MSEKRFTSNGRWIAEGTIVDICDNGKVIMQVFDDDNIQNVVDLLNKLYEENEQLKEENEKLIQNKCLPCELVSLQVREIDKLKEENEQLKDKIDVLEDDNETYHKSLEKLNLYTKRFIPTKCTNEFKDCKTNRYYWVDPEGNFEGCLELLNLLDCENEVLKFDNRELKGRLMLYEEQIKGDLNGRL